MLENARQLIEKYAVGKTVAAAVSGGEDSMALFFLLCGYAKEGKLKLKVVNVEHGIRENSTRDSEFVRETCAKEGIELISVAADIPALCKESGRGVESEAHHFRKKVFADVISSGKADLVATAHHARDNAETVLMHLFRGAGLKGLGGMNVCAHNIFRPFLTTLKREICEYVQRSNIKFVTDETNFDIGYDRNYIRHEILPRIEERYPDFENAIARASSVVKRADEYISAQLDMSAVTVNADGSVSLSEDKLDAPYIFEALSRMGKHSDVYMTAVDSVRALTAQRDCARADLGDGIVAAREYGKITFYRKTDKKTEFEIPFVLPEKSAKIRVGDVCLLLRKTESRGDFTRKYGNRTLVFRADGIPQTAVWRTRREGDRFTPFGGGRRKLKEYLIDKKVPQRKRDGLILLCSGEEVLLIVGMEISDKLKADGTSDKIFGIEECEE